MRPKTLLVLAVVVGALLALIYFAEDKVASTDERAAAAKRLVGAKADEIVALEIEWQGSGCVSSAPLPQPERTSRKRRARSRRQPRRPAPAGRVRGGSSSRSPSSPTTPPSPAWSGLSPASRRRAISTARRAATSASSRHAAR